LARAKAELAANTPDRLRYAALELRDAAEALTYDRALAFTDDIPPEEYKTWQPRKLMAVLVEIDPSINITKTISAHEQRGGRPASRDDIKTLGTDHVFTLADLKTTPSDHICTCPHFSKCARETCPIRQDYESAAKSSSL
jgi:hypothetical protein